MQKIASFLQAVVTPAAVVLIGVVVLHDHFSIRHIEAPSSPVNGKALGRSFAPSVASNLADGWLAAADALEQGRSVVEAQAALQAAWQASRGKAFAARVAPEFARVLPEGSEPTDPARRAEVVKLWRDFASGLKGGR